MLNRYPKEHAPHQNKRWFYWPKDSLPISLFDFIEVIHHNLTNKCKLGYASSDVRERKTGVKDLT